MAVHKKGLRVLVEGKKKAKGLSKSASLHWDVSPNAVWRFDDAFSGRSVTRCGLPELDVQTVAVRAAAVRRLHSVKKRRDPDDALREADPAGNMTDCPRPCLVCQCL